MTPVYFLAWACCNLTYRAWFRVRIYHAERVPAAGPVILASNHASYIDPPLVGIGLPRDINYLARESLFRFGPIAWLLHAVHAVPVDREGGGARGLKAILDRLHEGGGIVLFPEGTRTPHGGLQPARSGIGLAVIKSDAPVIPVRVFGTYEVWGRHRRWPRPGPVAVKFGEPLDVTALRRESQTCSKARLKEIYQETASGIMDAIRRLQPCRDCDRFPG